nr:uncharacterized protein LOC105863844 isoform X2 [Microcebus murinus]
MAGLSQPPRRPGQGAGRGRQEAEGRPLGTRSPLQQAASEPVPCRTCRVAKRETNQPTPRNQMPRETSLWRLPEQQSFVSLCVITGNMRPRSSLAQKQPGPSVLTCEDFLSQVPGLSRMAQDPPLWPGKDDLQDISELGCLGQRNSKAERGETGMDWRLEWTSNF